MAAPEAIRFDSVQIAVADLESAARAYAQLLGVPAMERPKGLRFQLGRGAVELEPGHPRIRSLRVARVAPDALPLQSVEHVNGLEVRLADPDTDPDDGDESVAPARGSLSASEPQVLGIDHVVVNTPDADRAIRTWRDRLGVRLALDREFPERGLRMLFFRSGGVTLEFVAALGSPASGGAAGDDVLHGIAYRVSDVAALRTRLVGAGFDVSPVREGQKAGTRVATVRSGTASVPTLLIEAARAPDDQDAR